MKVGTLEPAYEWVGDYCEGLMYSIMYTLRDVLLLNGKILLQIHIV